VRELKNLVFKAVMHTDTAASEVRACDLPFESASAGPKLRTITLTGHTGLSGVEKRVIVDTLTRAGGHRGRTAEQLGISRRTLSRKLKEYREEAQAQHDHPGALSYQQQRYFRVVTEFPVVISCADQQVHATCTNLSSSGVGLHLPQVGDFHSAVTLTFTLPNTSYVIEAKAQIAWMDAEGHAGFRFIEMFSDRRQELENWLDGQMAAEGWFAEPGLTHHL